MSRQVCINNVFYTLNLKRVQVDTLDTMLDTNENKDGGFFSWLTPSKTKSKDDIPEPVEQEQNMKSMSSEDLESIPWYRTKIPARIKALFQRAKSSINEAESWADYQDDPDWSFPMVKAHVFILDTSGEPNWFPVGPALRFLNQSTATNAVRQFSSYTMERIHHYAMNGESLHSLYAARKLVDVLIHIENRTFYAHRCVLCTHSEYFANILLENDLPPYAVTDITLKHINPELFKRFLHFAYTGDVFVNLEILYPLRRLANILKSKSMKAKLMIFMAETGTMDLEQAIKILSENTDRDAMAIAVEVVKSNFKIVMNDARFFLFSFENVLEIISGDNLCVNSELDAFWAVLFWVAYDYANRINFFPQLLSEVRFTRMTSLELMDCAKVTDMIKLSEKCKKMLITANWICHAREIGLEDPLGLPEHPQRHCLVDRQHEPPTVSEFDQRFLKYMRLMNRDVKDFSSQKDNTKLNRKRVIFSEDDDDYEEKADEGQEMALIKDEPQEEPKEESKKSKKSKSPNQMPKEVYIREDTEDDEHKDDVLPPNTQPQWLTSEAQDEPEEKIKGKGRSRSMSIFNSEGDDLDTPQFDTEQKMTPTGEKKKKKKKEKEAKLPLSTTSSEDTSSQSKGEKSKEKKKKEKKSKDKKKKEKETNLSASTTSLNEAISPEAKEAQPKEKKKKDKKKSKKSPKSNAGEESEPKKKKHSKESENKTSINEEADTNEPQKHSILPSWLKKKPDKDQTKEPMITDNIEDLVLQPNQPMEKKESKVMKFIDNLKSRSQSETVLDSNDQPEPPGPPGQEEPKKKVKKKKKKKKDKKKIQDQNKNKQNNTLEETSLESSSSEEQSAISDSSTSTNKAKHVKENKSDNSRGHNVKASPKTKLLDISDSFILRSVQKPDGDALSLWENSVFPVQDNHILSGDILLPFRQQKIVLRKETIGSKTTVESMNQKHKNDEGLTHISKDDTDVNKNNCRIEKSLYL
ncbi:serrate RNA effector molecule [Biomphalaria pfeifferi]|uniref:Serrate RNA effector molecule n=1 Tax=Biomphalaria pfeifferi TaxID=112525 RepID=A0AAD8BBC9_BIOPF|nr:serrate RNA effector molecule [Biomphalaria pfeifferi]